MECQNLTNITDVTLSIGGISFCLVLVPLTSAFGLFTNGLTLFLLIKPRKWQASNILFFGLILTDFLSLVLQFADSVLNIHQFVNYHFSSDKTFTNSLLKIVFVYIQYIFLSLSKPLILLIAIQRCSAVHQPLKFKRIWTKKRTTVMTLILTAIVVLIGIGDSVFLALSGLLHFDECNGTHFLTEFVFISTIYAVFDLTIAVIKSLIFFLPIPLTIILNIATVAGVVKNRNKLDEMNAAHSNRGSSEIEITKDMLIISLMFLVMNIPHIVSAAFLLPNRYDTFHVLKESENEVENLIYDASTCLIALNMTTNCLMYVLKTTRYKSSFPALCKGRSDNE